MGVKGMIRHISGRLRAQRICRLGLLAAAITSLGVFTNGQITLAAGVTRTPSGTSGNWSATGSWTSGLVPLNSPGDTVLYNNLASSSLTLDTNVTVGTLNLSSAINWSITVSTNTLTMDWTGGLSNPLSTSNAFIGVSGNGTLSLAPRINIANTQLDIGSVSGTTGTVTLTGAVGGTGNLNLKANGSGAISLAAINMTGALTNIGSGSGTVTISGVIGNNLTALTQSSSTSKLILNALNTYTGLTTVTAGTLQIGDNTLAGSLGGDLLNNSATAVSWVTNNNSGNQSYGGSIHGTGGFAKSATTGSLTHKGVSTYAGGTTLTAGLLVIGNAQALGSTNGSLSLGTSAASNVLDLHGYSISVGALTSSAGVGQISNNQTGSSSTLILGNGNTTGTYNGVIVDHTSGTGTLTLTKTGSGTQTFSGTNAYSGGTLVAGGTLTISANSLSGNGALTVTSSGGSAFGTATLSSTVPGNSSPFGTGALTLNGGTINLAPTGSGNSISYSGISQVPGTQLSFSGTSTIALLKGSQTSLAFTAGNAADTGNVLNRTAHGVLLLKPSAAANLGTTEKFLLNGTAPAVSNGMVSPWIVGQNTNATTNFYDFLTYGSNGFVVTTNYASHTSSFITGNNEIANVILSAAGSITDNGAHPYAVVVNVSASNPAPSVINPLQIGSGGIILNSSVNNPTFLTAGAGGALAFGATEGLIYLNSTGGGTGGSGLAVPLTGSGGITLSGNTIGTSLASSGNTYTGGLTINKGVILNGGTDNYFGDISNTVTLNGGGLMSVSDTSYSSARAINLGATGGYINSGNRSTSFAGNISGVGALQVGGPIISPWWY